jgi:death-on-curing protein
VIYLSFEDLILMHEVLIQRFGGSPGIRNTDALEAALNRPQCGYYPDLIGQASALFESLAVNHPFIDGNKRIAFAAMDTFLRINGMQLNINSRDAYTKILDMFDRQELEHHVIDAWLRSICQKKLN